MSDIDCDIKQQSVNIPFVYNFRMLHCLLLLGTYSCRNMCESHLQKNLGHLDLRLFAVLKSCRHNWNNQL